MLLEASGGRRAPLADEALFGRVCKLGFWLKEARSQGRSYCGFFFCGPLESAGGEAEGDSPSFTWRPIWADHSDLTQSLGLICPGFRML
jgi:hypothetical protein